ncbi:hypothetical protein BO79DRAFT_156688 [Aspergillus costaricaensis CBS 115574]|uniref:Uncharacterized protein n=1 Tax=Aspergillus costaricaensis CBS 115574 TaxID=1448317 RepID=A0ACD1I4C5_9EURO|nr:hypothetical protein BO79DRAFT_156688 [Aspergillus costaricaensis CBS 115574]RAK85133.1 hypothetical protein BO79DRAFT_156688 [Aspergillus costaricaensis CBS 115574]
MLSKLAYLTLPFCLSAAALSTQKCPPVKGIQTYQTTPQDGQADGQFTSCDNFFDSPKIQGINASSYDWWYFDAIGTDGVSSLAVVFFVEANRSGFTVTENFTNMDFIQISGTFPNGTVFSDFLFADNAIVSTNGDGSSGLWNNTGISWAGSPDLQYYVLTLDAEDLGYKGSFSMHSIAPPHYPCSPKRGNVSLEVLPGVGWANAVPDAETTVNVTIFGSELSFVGTGYHDKNWGVTGFMDNVGSWYWGHARMGPYSLVWLDALDPAYNEYASGYVAYQGQILVAECDNMKVRPIGENATFPPTSESLLPDGFKITVDVPELGLLEAQLTPNLATLTKPGYGRWIGSVNGSVNGVTYDTGVSGFEMFDFF